MEIRFSSHYVIAGLPVREFPGVLRETPEFVEEFVCEKTRRNSNPDYVQENQDFVQEKEDCVREFYARNPGDGACIRLKSYVFARSSWAPRTAFLTISKHFSRFIRE